MTFQAQADPFLFPFPFASLLMFVAVCMAGRPTKISINEWMSG